MGPFDEQAAPIVIRPGEEHNADALIARLVAMGYHREHQVEHRGEVAVRGGIIDVFPPTSDVPVRIDLWGDEVDRLTVFGVGDQRSSHDLPAAILFGCRELILTDGARSKAETLVSTQPWGSRQWERLAGGELFDGMESWLPYVEPGEHLLPDLLPAGADVVLIEPRRIRDRAVQLLDEEAALADALATTWGVGGGSEAFPRLHVPFDRLLQRSPAHVLALSGTPENPSIATITVRSFNPVVGDASLLAQQVSTLIADDFSVTLCAATGAGAARLSALLAEQGVNAPTQESASARTGAEVVAAPISRGCILPDSKMALLSETDITGRRVSHRKARPRTRATDGFFDDLTVGSFVVHRQHGVARFDGVTSRAMGGTTRDYLILQYRGSDRLYLPVDQIEAITPYTGGESPSLSKMGGADWQRTRAKARQRGR